MADIRINALATTASSTASDDFVAVDGSANGTRKLNAYSPSFGGNATVGGTLGVSGKITVTNANVRLSNAYALTGNLVAGTEIPLILRNSSDKVSIDPDGYGIVTGGAATVGGTLSVGGGVLGTSTGNDEWKILRGATTNYAMFGFRDTGSNTEWSIGRRIDSVAGAGNFSFYSSQLGANALTLFSATGNATLAGNLTVSGTGGFGGTVSITKAGGAILELNDSNQTARIRTVETGATHDLAFWAESAEKMRLKGANGNLLLGTTTDSANGKLQLATHTTSAGGIGFGTDTTFFRAAAGNLCLGDSGTNAALSLYNAGTQRAYLFAQGSGSTFFIGSLTAGWSTAIQSGNGTTALTLDSSQNATFAGRAGIGGAPITSSSLILRGSSLTSGATQVGLDQQTTFSSGATTAGRGIASVLVTTAASFTMVNGAAFYAITPVLGAGSSVTTNTGLYIANQGATGITNAYGIDIAAQSGAATTNVAIRAAGKIMFTSLPTSSAGLASGELWNDSGTVKIA